MDCGPKSIKLFQQKVAKAKTVVWNGPAGVFEFENFSKVSYVFGPLYEFTCMRSEPPFFPIASGNPIALTGYVLPRSSCASVLYVQDKVLQVKIPRQLWGHFIVSVKK